MKKAFLLLGISLSFLQCAGDIRGKDATATALINLKRPPFRSNPTGGNKVVVQSNTIHPSKVLIDNSVYSNTSDAACDLSITGRGGIDTGAIAGSTIYFLYAIPAQTGTTFDLVTSTSDPDTGPTGFPNWSYLGSFYTLSNKILPTFIYAQGRLTANLSLERFNCSLSDPTCSGNSPYSVKVPSRALSLIGFAQRDAQQSGTTYWSGTSDGYSCAINLDGLAGQSATQLYRAEIPLYEGKKIYIYNTNVVAGTYKAYWDTFGWTEDPTDWN